MEGTAITTASSRVEDCREFLRLLKVLLRYPSLSATVDDFKRTLVFASEQEATEMIKKYLESSQEDISEFMNISFDSFKKTFVAESPVKKEEEEGEEPVITKQSYEKSQLENSMSSLSLDASTILNDKFPHFRAHRRISAMDRPKRPDNFPFINDGDEGSVEKRKSVYGYRLERKSSSRSGQKSDQ